MTKGLTSPQGIPLATVLRINAARTIPIERYEEDGYFDRYGYLVGLSDETGVELETIIMLAEDIMGPEEDFDGLVCAIDDGVYLGLC